MPILPLPQDAARLLRAHVVIVTPLSVVKELVDNAIDAHASAVEVLISPNTVDRIEVRDNGRGISPSDYEALGRRGHTSKLARLEELKALGGKSLGFRGEAVAAMCAVGKVTVTTRTAGERMAAIFELLPAGKGSLKPASKPTPVGTTLTVADLFARYPVRRTAAIKDSRAILVKIKQLLAAYALARPCLKISLKELGSSSPPRWSYSPRLGSGIKEAASSLFGHDLAAQCIESFSLPPSTPVCAENAMEGTVRIEAFIPGPNADLAKISKGSFLAVDSRPVSSARGTFKKIVSSFRRHLRHCIDTSGNTALKDPFIALNIVCPTGAYDVNLEPAKDDVLFVDEQAIIVACDMMFERIYKAREPGGGRQQLAGPDGEVTRDEDDLCSSKALERTRTSADSVLHSCADPSETEDDSTPGGHHRETAITDASDLADRGRLRSRTDSPECSRGSMTPSTLQQIARRGLNWTVNMDADEISGDYSPSYEKTAKETGNSTPPTEDDEASRPLDNVNPWMLAKMGAAARHPHPSVPTVPGSHSSAHWDPRPTPTARDIPREEPLEDEDISPDDSISMLQDLDVPGSRRPLRSRTVQVQGSVPGGPFRTPLPKGGRQRQSQRSNTQQQVDTSNTIRMPPQSTRAEARARARGAARYAQGNSTGARRSLQQTRLPSWNPARPSRAREQENTASTAPSDFPSTRRDEAAAERGFESMRMRLPRLPSPPRRESRRGTATIPSFTSALTVLNKAAHRETDTPVASNRTKDDYQCHEHARERPSTTTQRRELDGPPVHSDTLDDNEFLESPTKDTLGLVTWAGPGSLNHLSQGGRLSSVDNYMLTGAIQYGLRAIDTASKARIDKLLRQQLVDTYGSERIAGCIVEVHLGEAVA
ncbi:hypothetical protein RB595_009252 [Gaeumannomyces hyphopodioides]